MSRLLLSALALLTSLASAQPQPPFPLYRASEAPSAWVVDFATGEVTGVNIGVWLDAYNGNPNVNAPRQAIVNMVPASSTPMSPGQPSISIAGLSMAEASPNPVDAVLLPDSENTVFAGSVNVFFGLRADLLVNEGMRIRWLLNRNPQPDLEFAALGSNPGCQASGQRRCEARDGYLGSVVHLAQDGLVQVSFERPTGTQIATVSGSYVIDSNNPQRDVDGDGIPDVVEAAIGLNPLSFDIDFDSDADGWSDFDEWLRCPEALTAEGRCAATEDPNQKPADDDLDGWSNVDELWRGTQPDDDPVWPQAIKHKPVVGDLYQVEYRINTRADLIPGLGNGQWRQAQALDGRRQWTIDDVFSQADLEQIAAEDPAINATPQIHPSLTEAFAQSRIDAGVMPDIRLPAIDGSVLLLDYAVTDGALSGAVIPHKQALPEQADASLQRFAGSNPVWTDAQSWRQALINWLQDHLVIAVNDVNDPGDDHDIARRLNQSSTRLSLALERLLTLEAQVNDAPSPVIYRQREPSLALPFYAELQDRIPVDFEPTPPLTEVPAFPDSGAFQILSDRLTIALAPGGLAADVAAFIDAWLAKTPKERSADDWLAEKFESSFAPPDDSCFVPDGAQAPEGCTSTFNEQDVLAVQAADTQRDYLLRLLTVYDPAEVPGGLLDGTADLDGDQLSNRVEIALRPLGRVTSPELPDTDVDQFDDLEDFCPRDPLNRCNGFPTDPQLSLAEFSLIQDMQIERVDVTEGQAGNVALISVQLDRPAPRAVEVEIAVQSAVGDTATGGDDYDARIFSLTIPSGERFAILVVDIVDDGLEEDPESFSVSILSAVNAVFQDQTVIVAINDAPVDDGSGGGGEPPVQSAGWAEPLHQGTIRVEVGVTRLGLSWDTTAGANYSLCVTGNPLLPIPQFASGCDVFLSNLGDNPDFPLEIDGLVPGQNVYFALIDANQSPDPFAWTASQPNAWGIDGLIEAQTIGADGRRYVGGRFKAASIRTGLGVTLPAHNPTASSPPRHALAYPKVNGLVRTAIADGDGGFFIAGDFSQVGGQERPGVAQIDRFGRLTDWNPAFPCCRKTALLSHDGIVYVGGNGSLRAVDATTGAITDWDPGIAGNGDVNAMAVDAVAGVLYFGGGFTRAGGGTTDDGSSQVRSKLAAADLATGVLTDWDPGSSGEVLALVVRDGIVYAGGNLGFVGQGTTSGTGGASVSRSGLAAFDSTGLLLDWNPDIALVRDFVLDPDQPVLYVGGNFTTAGGLNRQRLAAADLDTAAITSWDPGINVGNFVTRLEFADGLIYVGGPMFAAGGGTSSGAQQARTGLIVINRAGQLQAWNPELDFEPNEGVEALAVSDGVVYAGGDFNSAGAGGRVSRQSLAAFDRHGEILNWDPGLFFTDNIHALVEHDGVIYIGGDFLGLGGGSSDDGASQQRRNLAAANAAGQLTDWDPGVDRSVNALAVHNDVIYAGGAFDNAGMGATGGGSLPRGGVAAFNLAGGLTGWDPGVEDQNGNASSISVGVVNAIAIDNDVIYVGGIFDTAGTGTTGQVSGARGGSARKASAPQERAALAAFDLLGQVTSWDPGVGVPGQPDLGGDPRLGDPEGGDVPPDRGQVNALAVQNGTVYVTGIFDFAGIGATGGGQQDRDRLAAFTLGGALTDWNPPSLINSRIDTITASPSEVIYVGGTFGTALRFPTPTSIAPGAAAFDVLGNPTTWSPRAPGTVNSLLYEAGVIYIGAAVPASPRIVEDRTSLLSYDVDARPVAGPDLDADPDMDGLTTGQEYDLGTDPDDPNSTIRHKQMGTEGASR